MPKKPTSTRPLTGTERQAVNRLAHDLIQVANPGRAITKVPSELPPGQLDIREVFRGITQSMRGNPRATIRPYIADEIGETTYTPLTLGIMCDISGSMYEAMEPLAVARTVCAVAMHQVQGTVATVLFGNKAYGIQAPHEMISDVEVYEADGSCENFVDGFSMVDSAIDLIDGEGARLLVIITDGHFVLESAVTWAEKTMDMCRKSGVAVIWLTMDNYFARNDTYGWGRLVNAHKKSPVEVAEILGQAVLDEFKRAKGLKQ